MDDDYKFQLVLQLPGGAQHDFDLLVGLEDAVANALDGFPHEVDGHDFGSGTGNIFIDTNDPIGAFDLTQQGVNLSYYPMLRAAYRSIEEDTYTLIWPENSKDEFNLV